MCSCWVVGGRAAQGHQVLFLLFLPPPHPREATPTFVATGQSSISLWGPEPRPCLGTESLAGTPRSPPLPASTPRLLLGAQMPAVGVLGLQFFKNEHMAVHRIAGSCSLPVFRPRAVPDLGLLLSGSSQRL